MKKYLLLSTTLLYFACTQPKFNEIETPQNVYNLSTSADLLLNAHVNTIDSLYNWGKEGRFYGADSVEIYYKTFIQKDDEKGAIVISSGRTEAAIKYKEVIYDLYKNGYSVYINDHRGQGFSGRMAKNRYMGYVDHFQYYIDDLKYFYDNIVTQRKHEKYFLLAHSMGGAIGVTYLEQYPHDFRAAAFSSPMLGLSFPSCPVVKLIKDTVPEYALGGADYQESIESFEDNTLTGSKVRYERMLKVFDENPKAQLGGATYQWVVKSCIQFDSIFANISKIETPLVLFSGSKEKIVAPKAHNNFVYQLDSLNINATGYLVDGAKHEMLIETDKLRIEVMTKILDFYGKF